MPQSSIYKLRFGPGKVPDEPTVEAMKIIRGNLEDLHSAATYLASVVNNSIVGIIDHGALTGLGDDDHPQYLLLSGRSGGQRLFQIGTETPLTIDGSASSAARNLLDCKYSSGANSTHLRVQAGALPHIFMASNFISASAYIQFAGNLQLDSPSGGGFLLISPSSSAINFTRSVALSYQFDGPVTASGALRSATSLILEDPGAGSNIITIVAPSAPTSHTLTLPGANSSGLLSNNGSGALSWAAGTPFGGFANPTALVGLSAVNGVATTAMRSDGAPALDQGIVPTWTGVHTHSKSVIIATPDDSQVPIKIQPTPGSSTTDLYQGYDRASSVLAFSVDYLGNVLTAGSFGGWTGGAIGLGFNWGFSTGALTANRLYTLPDTAGAIMVRAGSLDRTNSSLAATTTILATANAPAGVYQVNVYICNGTTAGDRQLKVELLFTDARGARTITVEAGYALASVATTQQPRIITQALRTEGTANIQVRTSFPVGTTGTYNMHVRVNAV